MNLTAKKFKSSTNYLFWRERIQSSLKARAAERASALLSMLLCIISLNLSFPSASIAGNGDFEGTEIFNRIVKQADANDWQKLPIGELMGKIANELLATPYVGGVLDRSPEKEVCTVNLGALDCVTFFESTLDLARIIKKGKPTPESLLNEVTFTRYRNGKLSNYTSRLHYTSDWFYDNQRKHVVKLEQTWDGAKPFTQKVSFMSTHASSYPALAANPDFVKVLQEQESAINKRSLKYYPNQQISAIEPSLQTGDIIGICTNKPGLDITHTGIIFKDKQGVAHFMDASSKKTNMKVTLESGPISQYILGSKNNIGIMVARPLEPN